MQQDINSFKSSLISLFASIPYNNYTKNDIQNYEGFYASIVYVYLQSLGLDIVGEDVTNKGRIDLTIIMENAIYILEFKVDMPKETAMAQIESKKYYEKYQNQGNEIYLIGIHFNSEKRNIENMEWRKM